MTEQEGEIAGSVLGPSGLYLVPNSIIWVVPWAFLPIKSSWKVFLSYSEAWLMARGLFSLVLPVF